MGEKVAMLRRARQWTQRDLAALADVPQPVICRLEAHKQHGVHSTVLRKLAQALGCTTDYLVGMHEAEEHLTP